MLDMTEVDRLLNEAQALIDQAKALVSAEYPAGCEADVFIMHGQKHPTRAKLGAPYVSLGYGGPHIGIAVSFYPKRAPRFGDPQRSYRQLSLHQVQEVFRG